MHVSVQRKIHSFNYYNYRKNYYEHITIVSGSSLKEQKTNLQSKKKELAKKKKKSHQK
jgi:hypothetical protein